MRIGVISDTHGHVANTRLAVRMFESLEVTRLLHCGDIGSTAIPGLLEPWPTDYVLGNVDHHEGPLRAAIEACGQVCHGRFADLSIGGRRIAVLHGDDTKRWYEAKQSGQYDLICSGHTHVAETYQQNSTTVLNPGAVYRARPHTVAVVDLEQLQATIVPID